MDVTDCMDGVSNYHGVGIADVISYIVHPAVGVTDVNGSRECIGTH